MKLNFSEIKKWCDVEKEFESSLLYLINNWSENSLDKNSFVYNKFIKNDIIDLKEIEMYDELLFIIASNILFKSYIMKDVVVSHKIDYRKMQSLTQEEIMILHEEENNDISDNKKTLYYKTLKHYGFLTNSGVDVDMLSQHPRIKKNFIEISLKVIKEYGVDWNEDVFNALVKMNIITE